MLTPAVAASSARRSSGGGSRSAITQTLLRADSTRYTVPLTVEASVGAGPGTSDQETLAILLTGGGARAAYQVGYLRWIAQHIPEINFPILTGVSAGAINAAYLASCAGPQAEAIERLTRLWRELTVDKVFRVDAPSLLGHVARWGVRLVSGGGVIAPQVRGLLDSAPLEKTLASGFRLTDDNREIDGIQQRLESRSLSALAVLTSNYGTGQSVIWIQGRDLPAWERPDRRSRRTKITLDHVLASSALPLFFPAVRLDGAWYGDGGIRLTAPCSPAIHLGATRILALSTRYRAGLDEADRLTVQGYPPPLQISGQLLNAIFLDDLNSDARELERLNALLRDLPPEKRRGLRQVQLMVARPSQDLGHMVAEYEPKLPRIFRHLTRGLGSRETTSPDILSLLAFDPGYLNALIDLGEADAATHEGEIRALLCPQVKAS